MYYHEDFIDCLKQEVIKLMKRIILSLTYFCVVE